MRNAATPQGDLRPDKASRPCGLHGTSVRPELPEEALVRRLAARALAEDLGSGDVTTDAVCPSPIPSQARILAKQAGVLCGMPVAAEVFRQVEPALAWHPLAADGSPVASGQVLAEIHGDQRALLKAERTALNFLQHLSGIATLTTRYVAAISDLECVIMDTRKTIPGLRLLEKYAVACGGGCNHRYGLYDQVLIKENHIRAAGSIANAVSAVRHRWGRTLRVEVETESLADVRAALAAGADIIMLDDMSLADMRAAVVLVAGRVPLEASGSIRLDHVRRVAETGVARISVGALTHSAPALDLALYFA